MGCPLEKIIKQYIKHTYLICVFFLDSDHDINLSLFCSKISELVFSKNGFSNDHELRSRCPSCQCLRGLFQHTELEHTPKKPLPKGDVEG